MTTKNTKTTHLNTKPIDSGQKLLPAPKVHSTFRITATQNLLRLISTLIFAILGFNIADSDFFNTYPVFGVSYLAKLIITPLMALAGYFVLFEAVYALRRWYENLIVNTVLEIVSNFWELQSKKIQEQRRIKQKTKADTERLRFDEALKNAVAVDTSVLIDGRIVEITKLGFLNKNFIVAQEVIDELHLLSDNKDTLRRQKGRRGLDVVKELKKVAEVYIQKLKSNGDADGVDKMLVKFCKTRGIALLTLDFNLSKVAAVAGIKVLNINPLANSVKAVLLPGEVVAVKILSIGKEKKQGIGYLEDGTMLVVEDAAPLLGQEVNAVVVKVIQSQAGKMFFCKLSQ